MKFFVVVLVAVLVVFTAGAESYAQEDTRMYATGKRSGNDDLSKGIPPYLAYPEDAISNMIFKDKMKEVMNLKCNYSLMLYTETADEIPEVEPQTPPFDCNEIHYYCKEGEQAWYTVSIMRHESVRHNSVRNWVEKADYFAFAMGMYDIALHVPPSRRGKEFKDVGMYYIEQNEKYNQLHGFDESHLYCREFYLGDQLYKKFILVAKRDDWSWKVEVNIPSISEKIEPPDFIPAGQTFGRFYPADFKR